MSADYCLWSGGGRFGESPAMNTPLSLNIGDQAVAKVVREARKAAGLSQEALADAAGLHRTYISLLERARRSPTVCTLDAIGRALGFEPSKIYRLVAEAVEHGSPGRFSVHHTPHTKPLPRRPSDACE